MQEKYQKWKAGDNSVFIDPTGYKAYVVERQKAFEAELAKQKAAAK
jgi:hypothetical protein